MLLCEACFGIGMGSRCHPRAFWKRDSFEFLKRNRLPIPDRQVVIEEGGRFVGRVDFYFEHAKVIIEADSFMWHSGRREWERDRVRRNDLTLLGWMVLHVTWAQIHDQPRETAARLRRALGINSLPLPADSAG